MSTKKYGVSQALFTSILREIPSEYVDKLLMEYSGPGVENDKINFNIVLNQYKMKKNLKSQDIKNIDFVQTLNNVDILKGVLSDLDTYDVTFKKTFEQFLIELLNKSTEYMMENKGMNVLVKLPTEAYYLLFELTDKHALYISNLNKLPTTISSGFYCVPLSTEILKDLYDGKLFIPKLFERYYGQDCTPILVFTLTNNIIQFKASDPLRDSISESDKNNLLLKAKYLRNNMATIKNYSYKLQIPFCVLKINNMVCHLSAMKPFGITPKQFFISKIYDDQLAATELNLSSSILPTKSDETNSLTTSEIESYKVGQGKNKVLLTSDNKAVDALITVPGRGINLLSKSQLKTTSTTAETKLDEPIVQTNLMNIAPTSDPVEEFKKFSQSILEGTTMQSQSEEKKMPVVDNVFSSILADVDSVPTIPTVISQPVQLMQPQSQVIMTQTQTQPQMTMIQPQPQPQVMMMTQPQPQIVQPQAVVQPLVTMTQTQPQMVQPQVTQAESQPVQLMQPQTMAQVMTTPLEPQPNQLMQPQMTQPVQDQSAQQTELTAQPGSSSSSETDNTISNSLLSSFTNFFSGNSNP